MSTHHHIALFGLLGLLAGGRGAAQELPFAQSKDVVYAEVHGVGLLMDVFAPTGESNGRGIVDVASGAWRSDRGKIRDHKLAKLYDILCARGYTVFAARPGSRTAWTLDEMRQHVGLAIRYAKLHAKRYGIDPDKLGLTGPSAGGHLAALTAVTAEAGTPDDKNALLRHSTDVKAVGVFFPPTDFLDWDGNTTVSPRIAPLLFRGGVDGKTADEIKEAARKMSPRYQVHADAPPFLFIHGDADRVVPLQQSQVMVDALRKVGVSAELIVKEGGGHPWLTIPAEVAKLADWFDEQLK